MKVKKKEFQNGDAKGMTRLSFFFNVVCRNVHIVIIGSDTWL